MSSRARRVATRAVVLPFTWQTVTAVEEPPAVEAAPAEPAPVPADPPADPPPEPAVDQAAIDAHVAALEREAFAKGFAQGERAGEEAAARRGDAMLRRLTQTLEEMTELRARMIRETEHQLVRLAIAIARRIVHREISLDPDLLVTMARVAMDRLGDSAQITVRLNPDDFAATAASRAQALNAAHISVVADARLPRGGCRIESDFGSIDAGVDAQVQEIAHALLAEAPSRQ